MLRDNVWTTYKCRMNAERRYQSYNLLSHLLTSYYSLLLIVFSIFSSQFPFSAQASQAIGVALSVAAFSLSLILYGFHFSETAIQHRECYLKLQALLWSADAENIGKNYAEILQAYPNHSPRDYVALIFEGSMFGHSPLKRPETAEVVTVTFWTGVKYISSKIFFYLFGYVFLFAGPIGIVYFSMMH